MTRTSNSQDDWYDRNHTLISLYDDDLTSEGGVKLEVFETIQSALDTFQRIFTFNSNRNINTGKVVINLQKEGRNFGMIKSKTTPIGTYLLISVDNDSRVPDLINQIADKIREYLGYPAYPPAEAMPPGSPGVIPNVVPAQVIPQVNIPPLNIASLRINQYPNNQQYNNQPPSQVFNEQSGGRKRKHTRKSKSKKHIRRHRKTRHHKLRK